VGLASTAKAAEVSDRDWPHARTSRGLLPQQEEFLSAFRRLGNLKAALVATGFKSRRVWRWLREDRAFQDAFDKACGNAVGTAKKLVEYGTLGAVSTLLDAQSAMKGVVMKVHCPKCGEEFAVDTLIEDWSARLKSSEMLLKGAGILKDQREDIHVHLTFPELSALALLRGDPDAKVPPYMIDKFREMGLLPPGRGENVVEGEVREVPNA